METKTDRELLELAAKAAGLEVVGSDDAGWLTVVGSHPLLPGNENKYCWSPLDDDGDALRLAVKLGMDVDICKQTKTSWAMSGYSDQSGCAEHHGLNEGAATRRAIVRAAAEIGEQMP